MEIEFKFQVPPASLLALQRELAAGDSVRNQLQDHYFDTSGNALSKHGLVLRLRRQGPRWVQTAKATVTGNGSLRRLEHNVDLDLDLDLGDDILRAVPDIQRHAGSQVGKLLNKVEKQSGDQLIETFATDISRLTRIEQVGDTTIELALDVGKIVTGHGSAATLARCESPVCELELELVKGDVSDLVKFARRWSQRYGLWLSTLSKAERGRRLTSPRATGPIKAIAPIFNKRKGVEPSAILLQRAVISACLGQVLPNASEVAGGVEAPETVHQLRVGLRRVRTALRELDGLGSKKSRDMPLPSTTSFGFDPTWDDALAKVFRALGAHRDAHLLADDLQPRLRKAGAPPIDFSRYVIKNSGVTDSVRTAGFQAVLVDLIGFSESAGLDKKSLAIEEAKLPLGSVRKELRKRLDKLYRQILRDGKRFKSLTPEAQHNVRKRLKRLRYLSEFVGSLFGDKTVARFVHRLKPAQDALGALNDQAVAFKQYRHATESDPRAWFAVGWLLSSHDCKVEACQVQLSKLGKAQPFWSKD